MNSENLKDLIVDLIVEKKAKDVVVLDLRKVTSIADYFIICTGSAQPHLKAIADNVIDKLKDQGIKSWHTEGLTSLSWILIDYVDVVVHVFSKESREFYKLEKFWSDAKRYEIKDED